MRNASRVALLFLLAACATSGSDKTILTKAAFSELPGWEQDSHAKAYRLFVESCRANERRAGAYTSRLDGPIGDRIAWHEVCATAYRYPDMNDAQARQFFEMNFTPWYVSSEQAPYGQITGYYEPLLHGAAKARGAYKFPVYGVPSDLKPGQPYFTRAQIEAGALRGHAPVLLYVDDPVMLFFLQVQGSGKVEIEDGSQLSLHYAARNGQTYQSIGEFLKQRGELTGAVTMETIRDWLKAHPDQAQAVMNQNPAYVFFTLEPGGAKSKGSLGLPLTPMRSVAVDADRAAYGIPVYIATTRSDYFTHMDRPLNMLSVSQDTGNALHGPHRIDIFYGSGDEAQWTAGHQNTRGKIFWLLPNRQGVGLN